MATFTNRPGGKIQAQVRRAGFKPFSKIFTSKQDAVKWARQIEAAIDAGTIKPLTCVDLTFREALERYQTTVTPTKKGAEHELSRINWMKPRCKFLDKSLRDVKPVDVSTYRDARLSEISRRGRPVSGSSVNRELALVSHIFTTATKAWGIEGLDNPVNRIQKAREVRARERRVNAVGTSDELELILAHVTNPRAQAAYRLLVEMACRRSELTKLRWPDVNLGERVALLRDTKNGTDRAIPLSLKAVELLESLQAGHKAVGPVLGLRADYLTAVWRKARLKAGVSDIRVHDLRREGVSRLFEDVGLSSLEVSAISGHRSLAMLQRYTSLKRAGLLAKLDKANQVKTTANQSTEQGGVSC